METFGGGFAPLGKVSAGVALRGFLTNGRWLLGMGCTVVGWLHFVKATDLGEIGVVQPLISVGDLFLGLMAVVFLHERMNRAEWIGVGCPPPGRCRSKPG